MSWPSIDELVVGRVQRTYLKHDGWWAQFVLEAFAFLEPLGYRLRGTNKLVGVHFHQKGHYIWFEGQRRDVVIEYDPESSWINAVLLDGEFSDDLDDLLVELEPDEPVPARVPLDRDAIEASVRWWASRLERQAPRLLFGRIDADSIAADYFAPWEVDTPPEDQNFRRSSAALAQIERIVARNPDEGFALIVALASRAPSQDAVDLLGAGPLEDFVRKHGLAYLDQIDEAATRSEKFRSALTYTYGWDKVPNEVRERLLHHFPDRDPNGPPLRVTFGDAD